MSTKIKQKPTNPELEAQTLPPIPPAPRRVKIVPVSQTIFENIFQTGYIPDYEVTEGLPKDAKLAGIRHDVFQGVIHFLFSSDEFDEVDEGTIPPVLEIKLLSLPKANTIHTL